MHPHLLLHAVTLAEKHMLADDGGPFGAVIAHGEEIIAEGWNQVTCRNDPTAHAEIIAIRQACKILSRFQLQGCTLYTSCEPCPMCLAACYWARLDAVWYASDRHAARLAGFDDSFFHQQLALPPEQRTLPVQQWLLPDGDRPFRLWLEKNNRVPY